MRAREFTINIPINIKINSDGEPEIDMSNQEVDHDELEQNPVFVPPLQQNTELAKAAIGKRSGVIDKLLADDPEHGAEDDEPEVGCAAR